MQINRLFEIVYILLRKGTVTAKELSEHFEVSQRTIYRDIEILSGAGIPIYANRGKGGGIRLMEQFVLNKSVLTKQEQNDILSALQGIEAASFGEVSSTLSKLSLLFQTEKPDWIEVDFSYWSSREEDRLKFDQLKTAILNRKVISFQYFNSNGQETFRTAEPLKLIFKGQAWYLSGFCREKQAVRYFKISRMEDLELHEELFPIRPTIASMTDGSSSRSSEEDQLSYHAVETVWITLRVAASMAFRVYDEYPKEAITRLDDGSFLIRSPMRTGSWLYGYLLSYEDQLEVLEPEPIKNELAAIIKKMNALYNI